LKNLGYTSNLGLASLASDNTSMLIGQTGYDNGVTTALSGRASKESYLIHKGAAASNFVRIVPDRLDVDPYLDTSLATQLEIEAANVYGVELKCQFGEDILHYQDSAYGSFFDTSSKFELPIQYNTGLWTGVTSLYGSAEAVTGTGIFGNLNHQVAVTTANVDLTCDAILSDAEGNALPVAVEGVTLSIDDGIHGLPGESGSISGTLDLPTTIDGAPVTVTVNINGRSLSADVINGEFEFGQLRDGTFTVTVESENHVAACTTVEVVNGEVVELAPIEVISGDVNADGTIDIGDLTLMAASYGLTSSDAGYSDVLDLNRDGRINVQDLAILGSHFGATGCEL